MRQFIQLLLSVLVSCSAYAKDREFIELWHKDVPGQSEAKAASVISKNNRGNVTRIEKVTNPGLIIYEADPKVKNGAAVIICPGGGYSILAVDLEGYEIAEWFSKLGYTAFVLHYRVPKNREGALQDAQRAIRYVRGTCKERRIDASKIGILGFSAGGSLSARASTRHLETLYDPIDQWDQISARPDFAVLIYPAYLDQGPNHSLTPELKITKDTPPMFIFVAANDPYANSSLVMSTSLRTMEIPYELHVLPEGGHGFGMRSGKRAAETWPKLCEEWLKLTVFE
ncbi:alpha/beta hydrolase [Puniceicoccaceae bacterium]|nr:alpha/beta hydrolase [Puniceicoccaceae bacterium]